MNLISIIESKNPLAEYPNHTNIVDIHRVVGPDNSQCYDVGNYKQITSELVDWMAENSAWLNYCKTFQSNGVAPKYIITALMKIYSGINLESDECSAKAYFRKEDITRLLEDFKDTKTSPLSL
jgi:hypothetical protein